MTVLDGKYPLGLIRAVILPQSALEELTQREVQYPLVFRIANEARGEAYTHCSVKDFDAEPGRCYAPKWMMEMLSIDEGDIVRLTNVSLPKGSFVVFQPHDKEFLDLKNPKAVLEVALRNYSCLTKHRHIAVQFSGRTFLLQAKDLQPGEAVSIMETDLNTEFALPPGVSEGGAPADAAPHSSIGHEAGAGEHLRFPSDSHAPPWARPGGKTVIEECRTAAEAAAIARQRKARRLAQSTNDAFHGQGRRLADAKPVAPAVESAGPATTSKAAGSATSSTERPRAVFPTSGGFTLSDGAKRQSGNSGPPAARVREEVNLVSDDDDEGDGEVETTRLDPSIGGMLIRPKGRGRSSTGGRQARASAAESPAAATPGATSTPETDATDAQQGSSSPAKRPRVQVFEGEGKRLG